MENINQCCETTLYHLMSHVEAQKAFINFKHPEFTKQTYKLESKWSGNHGEVEDSDDDQEDDANNEKQEGAKGKTQKINRHKLAKVMADLNQEVQCYRLCAKFFRK